MALIGVRAATVSRMLGRALSLVAIIAGALALAPPASADRLAAGGVRLAGLGSFHSPTFATAPPGDPRVYVVEQGGGGQRARIVVLRRGRQHVFLDLTARVATSTEQGLLSMAFAPDYRTSGRFYVYYTRRPDNAIQIDEYRRSSRSPDLAVPSSRRSVITDPHPTENHNGGQLQFGPDGYLWAGIGDGNQPASLGAAQDLALLRGKLIRIDPRPSGGRAYGVPGDNPFVGQRGARPEIFALGLRNPWRFSFDRLTGDLAVGDVGQNRYEEVDWLPAGRGAGSNFGWGVYQGFARFDSQSDLALNPAAPVHARPVLAYPHAASGCRAITGGYVVRDRALGGLLGRYLFADFCVGDIRSVRLSARPAGLRETGLVVGGLTSFGEDGACRILVASKYAGRAYRLVPSGRASASGCQPGALR
jgi:glucose/arabinose dehydrogenase